MVTIWKAANYKQVQNVSAWNTLEKCVAFLAGTVTGSSVVCRISVVFQKTAMLQINLYHLSLCHNDRFLVFGFVGWFLSFLFYCFNSNVNSNVLTAYENITQNDTYILKDRFKLEQ